MRVPACLCVYEIQKKESGGSYPKGAGEKSYPRVRKKGWREILSQSEGRRGKPCRDEAIKVGPDLARYGVWITPHLF